MNRKKTRQDVLREAIEKRGCTLHTKPAFIIHAFPHSSRSMETCETYPTMLYSEVQHCFQQVSSELLSVLFRVTLSENDILSSRFWQSTPFLLQEKKNILLSLSDNNISDSQTLDISLRKIHKEDDEIHLRSGPVNPHLIPSSITEENIFQSVFNLTDTINRRISEIETYVKNQKKIEISVVDYNVLEVESAQEDILSFLNVLFLAFLTIFSKYHFTTEFSKVESSLSKYIMEQIVPTTSDRARMDQKLELEAHLTSVLSTFFSLHPTPRRGQNPPPSTPLPTTFQFTGFHSNSITMHPSTIYTIATEDPLVFVYDSTSLGNYVHLTLFSLLKTILNTYSLFSFFESECEQNTTQSLLSCSTFLLHSTAASICNLSRYLFCQYHEYSKRRCRDDSDTGAGEFPSILSFPTSSFCLNNGFNSWSWLLVDLFRTLDRHIHQDIDRFRNQSHISHQLYKFLTLSFSNSSPFSAESGIGSQDQEDINTQTTTHFEPNLSYFLSHLQFSMETFHFSTSTLTDYFQFPAQTYLSRKSSFLTKDRRFSQLLTLSTRIHKTLVTALVNYSLHIGRQESHQKKHQQQEKGSFVTNSDHHIKNLENVTEFFVSEFIQTTTIVMEIVFPHIFHPNQENMYHTPDTFPFLLSFCSELITSVRKIISKTKGVVSIARGIWSLLKVTFPDIISVEASLFQSTQTHNLMINPSKLTPKPFKITPFQAQWYMYPIVSSFVGLLSLFIQQKQQRQDTVQNSDDFHGLIVISIPLLLGTLLYAPLPRARIWSLRALESLSKLPLPPIDSQRWLSLQKQWFSPDINILDICDGDDSPVGHILSHLFRKDTKVTISEVLFSALHGYLLDFMSRTGQLVYPIVEVLSPELFASFSGVHVTNTMNADQALVVLHNFIVPNYVLDDIFSTSTSAFVGSKNRKNISASCPKNNLPGDHEHSMRFLWLFQKKIYSLKQSTFQGKARGKAQGQNQTQSKDRNGSISNLKANSPIPPISRQLLRTGHSANRNPQCTMILETLSTITFSHISSSPLHLALKLTDILCTTVLENHTQSYLFDLTQHQTYSEMNHVVRLIQLWNTVCTSIFSIANSEFVVKACVEYDERSSKCDSTRCFAPFAKAFQDKMPSFIQNYVQFIAKNIILLQRISLSDLYSFIKCGNATSLNHSTSTLHFIPNITDFFCEFRKHIIQPKLLHQPEHRPHHHHHHPYPQGTENKNTQAFSTLSSSSQPLPNPHLGTVAVCMLDIFQKFIASIPLSNCFFDITLYNIPNHHSKLEQALKRERLPFTSFFPPTTPVSGPSFGQDIFFMFQKITDFLWFFSTKLYMTPLLLTAGDYENFQPFEILPMELKTIFHDYVSQLKTCNGLQDADGANSDMRLSLLSIIASMCNSTTVFYAINEKVSGGQAPDSKNSPATLNNYSIQAMLTRIFSTIKVLSLHIGRKPQHLFFPGIIATSSPTIDIPLRDLIQNPTFLPQYGTVHIEYQLLRSVVFTLFPFSSLHLFNSIEMRDEFLGTTSNDCDVNTWVVDIATSLMNLTSKSHAFVATASQFLIHLDQRPINNQDISAFFPSPTFHDVGLQLPSNVHSLLHIHKLFTFDSMVSMNYPLTNRSRSNVSDFNVASLDFCMKLCYYFSVLFSVHMNPNTLSNVLTSNVQSIQYLSLDRLYSGSFNHLSNVAREKIRAIQSIVLNTMGNEVNCLLKKLSSSFSTPSSFRKDPTHMIINNFEVSIEDQFITILKQACRTSIIDTSISHQFSVVPTTFDLSLYQQVLLSTTNDQKTYIFQSLSIFALLKLSLISNGIYSSTFSLKNETFLHEHPITRAIVSLNEIICLEFSSVAGLKDEKEKVPEGSVSQALHMLELIDSSVSSWFAKTSGYFFYPSSIYENYLSCLENISQSIQVFFLVFYPVVTFLGQGLLLTEKIAFQASKTINMLLQHLQSFIYLTDVDSNLKVIREENEKIRPDAVLLDLHRISDLVALVIYLFGQTSSMWISHLLKQTIALASVNVNVGPAQKTIPRQKGNVLLSNRLLISLCTSIQHINVLTKNPLNRRSIPESAISMQLLDECFILHPVFAQSNEVLIQSIKASFQ